MMSELAKMNKDYISMNNLVSSTITFSGQLVLSTLLTTYLLSYLPMITLFKIPWKQICSTEDVKKVN
ncbi:hypothetical protein FWK35_00018872 [Aphis craccivora]|uniref:Uncharacterized protein n=1 Tax=Aphis craccivora TaxID=307492 RepID=A0A6G0Y2Z9_APHCR|nr:hypothetical protein FWK35_00018872 [Aphis craccivora]